MYISLHKVRQELECVVNNDVLGKDKHLSTGWRQPGVTAPDGKQLAQIPSGFLAKDAPPDPSQASGSSFQSAGNAESATGKRVPPRKGVMVARRHA